ncbi:MAG: hypothetical protein DKINENOH_04098 [bacterium]|nr:hypothetical protein [bacterium]MCK6562166.1 hypothetical protein [bacterium]NUM63867.1 hypothetical protein [candidate division KSB1 bacterium]
MLKTILSYLGAAIIGAALAIWLWPRDKVTVTLPPAESYVDSLATAKFETRLAGLTRVFADAGEYQAFIDSLKASNRVYVRVPVRVPGESRIDTVQVAVDCPCVPEAPGQEFSAHLKHTFAYPAGDTSLVRVSARYAQFDWPLHPSGAFKDVSVYIPPVTRTVEVPKPPSAFFPRFLGKVVYFGLGAGAGYLVCKL